MVDDGRCGGRDDGGGRVVGIVLAGGLARRLGGGDKALRPLAGRALVAHVLDRLAPQVAAVAIGASGDPGRFGSLGVPVLADAVAGNAGPLAGILAGMEWAAIRRPAAEWLVSVPCDCPFLPADLVRRLAAARVVAGAEIAVARSAGRDHGVVALWPVGLRDRLREALAVEGLRAVGRFAARRRVVGVAFPTVPIDPFFNVNRPEDLAAAAAYLADGTPLPRPDPIPPNRVSPDATG